MPRLDQLLVARGLYSTRARARDAILRRTVRVGDKAASKPGQVVVDDAHITVDDDAASYASRAALKLKHGLDHFNISPKGLVALDLGASAGGFTQVLLERGAAHVIAVDVGHGQLVETLRRHPRVTAIEGLNARYLDAGRLPATPQLVVADLSFISLKVALPPALFLAAAQAWLLALIKPQFEAGPAHVDGAGLVRDPTVHEQICRDIANWLEADQGWRVVGVTQSPIAGRGGNVEFLLAAIKP